MTTPADWIAGRTVPDAGTLPEAADQAALHFKCAPLDAVLSGPSCAKRHSLARAAAARDAARSEGAVAKRGRTYRGAHSDECAACPLGARRVALLSGKAEVPVVPNPWATIGGFSNPDRKRLRDDLYIRPPGRARPAEQLSAETKRALADGPGTPDAPDAHGIARDPSGSAAVALALSNAAGAVRDQHPAWALVLETLAGALLRPVRPGNGQMEALLALAGGEKAAEGINALIGAFPDAFARHDAMRGLSVPFRLAGQADAHRGVVAFGTHVDAVAAGLLRTMRTLAEAEVPRVAS